MRAMENDMKWRLAAWKSLSADVATGLHRHLPLRDGDLEGTRINALG